MQILNEITTNNTAQHNNIFCIIHLIYLAFNIFNGIHLFFTLFYFAKLKLIPEPRKVIHRHIRIFYCIRFLIVKFLFFSALSLWILKAYVPIVCFPLLYFTAAAVRSSLSQPEAISTDSHHFKIYIYLCVFSFCVAINKSTNEWIAHTHTHNKWAFKAITSHLVEFTSILQQ